MSDAEKYTATNKRIEEEVVAIRKDDVLSSIAISLKRIADALEFEIYHISKYNKTEAVK
jgi:hypothetical protein